MINWLSQSINLSQASLNKKSPFIHSTSLSSFRLIVQVPLTDFYFSYIKAIYYNVWLNKLTLSRGLLLLLSFAEHKVISNKSSPHNTIASGIFIKVCMMRKPVKTGKRSKLWPNILLKGITFNDLLTFFLKRGDNKQRELMICGEVIIVLERKKNQFHSSISGRLLAALLEKITMSLQLYIGLTRALKTLRHFVEKSPYDRTLATAKQYSNKKTHTHTQQNKASSSKPYIEYFVKRNSSNWNQTEKTSKQSFK